MRVSSRWAVPPSRVVLPAVLRSWLLEPGSLTARCQAAARHFRVRLLHSGCGPSLMAAGGAPRTPFVREREVLLECDGVPVIFAHSELTLRPRGRLTRWLARLGSRSLGSMLFADPGFRRGAIEYRRLSPQDVLYQRAIAAAMLPATTRLWARRSRHCLGRQSVMVTEVFLPAILRLTESA